MELNFHPYRYYEYEKELARREVSALLGTEISDRVGRTIVIPPPRDESKLRQLVYFASASDGSRSIPTLQAQLEQSAGNGQNRQATRYSAHGLHEYKGKFNPQIARAILNILGVRRDAFVLDPFCGSGTSLLECCHLGITAIGVDINPLAVFIANAKLDSIRSAPGVLRHALNMSLARYSPAKTSSLGDKSQRLAYLKNWFREDILEQMEGLRVAILKDRTGSANTLLTVASDLLREFSYQDPKDLRIRRRKDALPERSFVDAFAIAAELSVSKIEAAQAKLGPLSRESKALLRDSRELASRRAGLPNRDFDCLIASPPYATALPYIDTQRLSLVWLGLLEADDILPYDSRLIGSREVRGERKESLVFALSRNTGLLPQGQANFCLELQSALTAGDGFRRKATPLLLYRYFSRMSETFKALRQCARLGAPFALVVGSNHTTLGGTRFEIDTPAHLAELAKAQGWEHEETIPLETYQRYGYHARNAITAESLVVLRAN